MKKPLKVTGLLFFTIVVLFTTSVVSHAATVSLQSWDLVDSGKQLDWDGSTKYMTEFNYGVTTWNNYKSGVIRPDTIFIIQDVAISDFYEVSSTAGVTSSVGTIKFNDYKMQDYNTVKKKFVTTHELGHALGLEHNLSGDIMYKYVSEVTSLSANDKASYDAAYNNY